MFVPGVVFPALIIPPFYVKVFPIILVNYSVSLVIWLSNFNSKAINITFITTKYSTRYKKKVILMIKERYVSLLLEKTKIDESMFKVIWWLLNFGLGFYTFFGIKTD